MNRQNIGIIIVVVLIVGAIGALWYYTPKAVHGMGTITSSQDFIQADIFNNLPSAKLGIDFNGANYTTAVACQGFYQVNETVAVYLYDGTLYMEHECE